MRFLGIDYGSRRIGIAVSDENNTMAFPKMVVTNDKNTISTIEALFKEYKVTGIVLGESKNYKGEDNPIMKDIDVFKDDLQKIFELEVILEPEFMTSQQAAQNTSDSMLDASAAALILQSYLDRKNSK